MKLNFVLALFMLSRTLMQTALPDSRLIVTMCPLFVTVPRAVVTLAAIVNVASPVNTTGTLIVPVMV